MLICIFDLEKASDIMKDLKDIGLQGNVQNFISNFISDWNSKESVGFTFSRPQGSILSITCNGEH